MTIRINDTLSIDESELTITYIRASGPGGQNVNKVSSAAQLRFDARNTPSLPAWVRRRLERIAGSRLTTDGEIVITAERHRTQEANRRDAIQRLVEMIREAAQRPKRRIPTKPSRAARAKRVDSKTKRGRIKRLRKVDVRRDD